MSAVYRRMFSIRRLSDGYTWNGEAFSPYAAEAALYDDQRHAMLASNFKDRVEKVSRKVLCTNVNSKEPAEQSGGQDEKKGAES